MLENNGVGYVRYVHQLPLELREHHEPEATLMQPCERMSPIVWAAALTYMGTTGRPKVKLATSKHYQAARRRYASIAAWVPPGGDLEAWVLRRGQLWEIWLGKVAVAEIETGRSPWWGKHVRRRTR